MQLAPIQALVEDQLQAVNELIIQCLDSKASLISDLGHYIVQSGGKRLRPLILLLLAQACGYEGSDHINIATTIEFIHTATLLHDDIVDGSPLRRGKKAANLVWGNEAAVLVGDFLYSKAFQMLVKVANVPIMQVLADATTLIAEGEALQLQEQHNPQTTEENYFNVIRCKTAKLFETSARIGAILGKVEPRIEEAIAQYGMHLGIAFQLMDDVLDYEASATVTGKVSGNDLSGGKVTLPLIYLLKTGTPEEIEMVQKAIQTGGDQHLSAIQQLLHTKGALQYTRQYAQQEAKKAQQYLALLNPSPYREAAHALADFAVQREY